jgi:hypothetical protein
MPKRVTIKVTTNTSGDGTGYSAVVSGEISTVRYVKTDFANSSTITITLETTGETVLAESNINASASRAPRQATHTIAGAAALYAGSGTAVNDRIIAVQERIKVVVAGGGSVTTGTFYVTLV